MVVRPQRGTREATVGWLILIAVFVVGYVVGKKHQTRTA